MILAGDTVFGQTGKRCLSDPAVDCYLIRAIFLISENWPAVMRQK